VEGAERRREQAKANGLPDFAFKLATGARLVFADGTPDIVAYPATRHGWGRLTRLLTVGNRRALKGDCILFLDDLLGHLDDLLLIVMPGGEGMTLGEEGARPHPAWDPSTSFPRKRESTVTEHSGSDGPPSMDPRFCGHDGEKGAPSPPPSPQRRLGAMSLVTIDGVRVEELTSTASREKADMDPSLRWGDGMKRALAILKQAAPDRIWLGLAMPYSGRDRRTIARHARLAEEVGVPLLATNDALYATPQQRPLHDVVTCIRLGLKIDEAGTRIAANAERHLKPGKEMARLFVDHRAAVDEGLRLLDRIGFDLEQLKYEYPHEPVPSGWTPQKWLEKLVADGVRERYGDTPDQAVIDQVETELQFVRQAKYAYYFLTVHDVVRFARSKDILCQGRGSAANSIICYVLGVTSVDPIKHKLLFSRFISEDRNEPPDIDVDFEHERREEVMQYVFNRYGRHRAGIAATVIHYRPRSAVREIAKVLGLSEDVAAKLTSTIWGSYAAKMEDKRFHETGFDPGNVEIGRLNMLVAQLLTFRAICRSMSAASC
jgi:error-prone DNA polymerase